MTKLRWAAAGAALCLCSACGGDEPSNRLLGPEEIAQVRLLDTNLALPPGATDVWRHELSFQDAVQLVRFDAGIGEARAFARQALGRDLVAGEDPGIARRLTRHWWLQRYPANGEGGSAGDTSRSVSVVLEPRGERARVWFSVVAD